MNAMILNNFKYLGLRVWLDDDGDKLNVSGLKTLEKEKADEVRGYIARHRQQIIEELKAQPKYEIEPMTRCLHQEPCVYLISERGCRPWCAIAGEAIFDMRECPRALWFETRPVVMQRTEKMRVEITLENCPARCRRTGLCYHSAAFGGRAGKGRPCHPDQCEHISKWGGGRDGRAA
jgi:hypothetical protein